MPLPRRPISFQRLVLRVSDQYGSQAATNWVKTVLGHQTKINERLLRAAIKRRDLAAIERLVNAKKLQVRLTKVMQRPLQRAAQAAGKGSAQTLAAHGLAMTFNASDPAVAQFARRYAAELVRDLPKQTKQVIAEVVARGAEGRITVTEQAQAIREMVGLPPNWINAPLNFAAEIRAGDVAAATGRRISGVMKQQIRSAVRHDAVTNSFIAQMQKQYTASLINRRALNIARTESHRAANFGLTESWKQAQTQGILPANTRRYWIVTPDNRLSPAHSRIPGMNPNGRGLQEPFLTTEGAHMYPPSRPNCRCHVGLGFPGRRR